MAKTLNFSPCVILLTLLLLIIVPSFVNGADLFPFDSHTSILEGADDKEFGVNLTYHLRVSGEDYDKLYVTSNGLIVFTPGRYAFQMEIELNEHTYPPDPVIAGFLADSVVNGSSAVWIKQTTNDTHEFEECIRVLDSDFDADWATIVTWENLTEYGKYEDEFNSFQVVLASDQGRQKSYAIFSYNKIEWIRDFVQNGFAVGRGMAVRGLPGVDRDTLQTDLLQKSNVGIPGRFVVNIGAGAYCPRWTRATIKKNACMKLVKKRRNFYDARTHCQNLGGDLLMKIQDGKQRTHVMRWIRSTIHLWIGVHSPDGAYGNFYYVNWDNVWGRHQWKRGRPSKNPGTRNCVSLRLRKWYDNYCSRRMFFICQMNMM